MGSSNSLNQIFLGDALEVMRQLPDQSIDALISDPPYGTTALKWDKSINWQAFWLEVQRICKPTAIVSLFSQQPFTTDLINSNRKQFRYELVWHKSLKSGFLDAQKRPLRVHENILVFSQKFRGAKNSKVTTYNPQKTPGKPYKAAKGSQPNKHYGSTPRTDTVNETGDRYPVDVLYFPNGNYKSLHPTQKPIDLMKWLIVTYTNPGDVVLDPFLGSGTTVVACMHTGRNWIGIEKEPDYVKICQKRLQEANTD